MKTYHISGHIKITVEEFREHYEARIDAAIAEGANFVVEDAFGVDSLAQSYLSYRLFNMAVANGTDQSGRVIVYHMYSYARNNVGTYPTRGGYTSDEERDAAMTRDSDDDIAWVRSGRENSGTAKNLLRRQESLR